MDGFIEKLKDSLELYGPSIIAAIVILIVGKIIAKIVRSVIVRVMKKSKVDEALISFTSNLAYAAMMAFVFIAAIGKLGVQTTSFVAIIGAAGLAVGLALQGSLSNFASGVMLILFKPFGIGQFIDVAGTAGVVENISIFTTELKTGDNKKIIIPNAKITDSVITNVSAKDTRRIDFVFGVGYGDDLDKVKSVITDVLNADERILKDPAPTIGLVELADSSVNYAVRPWVKSADYWAVYFDVNEAIKKRFDAEGISIPFPQRDVHHIGQPTD